MAINDFNSLCILLYRTDDTSQKPLKYYFNDISTNISDQEKPSDQVTGNASNEHWAQSSATSTKKATVRLLYVPFGKYKMYAIANVPEEVFTDYVISDIENVRNLHFEWKQDNIAENNQMFGYFSTEGNSGGFEAPELTISQSNQTLKAWLRRLASKVTIAFDASHLKDDITIYLLSATIKDIPARCYLGKPNEPGKYSGDEGKSEMNELINNGQTINYVKDPGRIPFKEDSWPAWISNKKPVYGLNTSALESGSTSEKISAQHGENVNALYFFENMQGEGKAGTASDKWQVVEGSTITTEPSFPDGNTPPDGSEENNPEKTGFKDAKPYGTYIEVLAYYISDNPQELSRGYITYRFMLGKDTHLDFNAERNHHFKVTLCFNGYANDVDWHINFDQTAKIIGVNPYHISYLYNQSMDYTFTVEGGELISLKAQIPVNDITKTSWRPKNGEVTPQDQADAASVGGKVYWNGTVNDPGPWNGFLSLRETTETEYGTVREGYGADNEETYKINKIKFYGSEDCQPENDNVYNLGYRVYDVVEGTHEEPAGTYTIEKEGSDEVWRVTVPLFTRPRVMAEQTGYSGNNPYVAYNRQSQVTFTAKVRTPEGDVVEVSKTVDVVQARRIVNPKAVWRAANSTKPFHVQLKIRESQTSKYFQNLISAGPWRAEVVKGDWILLKGTEGVSELRGGKVFGCGNPYDERNPGSTIDFSFQPEGTTLESRGGIIKVYYNNYSCVHTIFVRQGYDPVNFYNSDTMWHTCNLLTGGDESTAAKETDSPLLEGSYFRQYNRKFPIDAKSNTAKDPFEIENGLWKQFNLAGYTWTRKWEQITLDPMPTEWGNFLVTMNNKEIECRLPSQDDWNNIIDNPNTIYGFGVLYGDCDEETQQTQEEIGVVYGARTDTYSKGYGMRGVIVCDESTGTQIFLPIAASGYGRFKQRSPAYNALRLPGNNWGGVVQYANRYTWFTQNWGYGVHYKPLFYDIYSSQGAIYWLKDNYVLDINYITLGFSITSATNAGIVWENAADPSGSDAIHLRLVHDKPKPATPTRSK